MTKPAALVAVTCIVFLAFVATARAEERTVWTHERGFFVKQEGQHWTEGGVFEFLEKARTPLYVELHDERREIWVRLYDNRAEIRRPDGEYVPLYQGGWKK